jgi:hypothetical protein
MPRIHQLMSLSARKQSTQFQRAFSMKTKCLLPIIALAALVASGGAGATTITGSASNVTGISGLVVDGTAYDVSFSTTSYNTTFPGPPNPTFLGNSSAALDANSALQALFNGVGVTGLAGQACGSIAECFLAVPYQSNTTNVTADFIYSMSPILTWTASSTVSTGGTIDPNQALGLDASNGHFYALAVFSPAPGSVPEPGALALMLAGIGALGFFATQRRAAARGR